MSGGPARFAVVGTPGDRRVTMFGDAVVRHGLPAPIVIPWCDVLAAGEALIPPGALVRIDSPGEDARADALLRGPGDPSRVAGGARWYRTFTAGLARVRDLTEATPSAHLLGDPGEIAVMFDKRLTHRRLQAAGVPVPDALPGPISSYGELREAMARRRWARVFVKPAHGSSASGVIAFQAHGARVKAVTSADLGPGPSLHNSLRIRTYETEDDVAAIVDALAPDRLHVERWFPKASIAGRAFDLRVVCVAGTPTHAVVRASRSPMTNLHLGGVRGDLDAVAGRLGDAGWDHAMDVCARAAACFPRSLAVGVDLLVATGFRSVAVAEVNAFGDLLPGLPGLPGTPGAGLDTYATQVAAALGGRFAASSVPEPREEPGEWGGEETACVT
ncbi:STM4014 family protein [Microtetraspora sp. AC03309]|uniref:STM4014 family protein n=1 Tax=Microtetraspora sp. AC03309 TaxID=2779376 RepID=UPI001E3764D6|nr:STM4014 family protein [Microtetraspora sp. AC03309]MCC5577576.1 STM4014 family protein [Microtetraspora sp. AC03309]